MEEIKVLKIREVKTPSRANSTDAGIDFYMPEINTPFLTSLREKNPHIPFQDWSKVIKYNPTTNKHYISLPPMHRLLIPSGVKTWYDIDNSALIAFNKSGLASKNGIIVMAQVSDKGYSGELHLNILNTGNIPFTINGGDKVTQFVHVPIILSNIIEVDEEEYNNISKGTTRGSNGFGSTNNK